MAALEESNRLAEAARERLREERRRRIVELRDRERERLRAVLERRQQRLDAQKVCSCSCVSVRSDSARGCHVCVYVCVLLGRAIDGENLSSRRIAIDSNF